MAYEVIVLGGSGTYPAPGSACSGYLFKSATTNLWVDCGPGSFANLQRHIKPSQVNAILLSHMHLDHVLDLYPFLYNIRYGPEATGPQGLDVYAPEGAAEFLCSLVSPGDPTFGGYLNFKTITNTLIQEIGDFEIRFGQTTHPVETYAVRLTTNNQTVAYTADTGSTAAVSNFVWGANLLIAEASLQAPSKEMAAVHMTAAEAGDMATRACVSQLLLTHIVPGLDPKVSLEQAARGFRGEILVASDNLRIFVY